MTSFGKNLINDIGAFSNSGTGSMNLVSVPSGDFYVLTLTWNLTVPIQSTMTINGVTFYFGPDSGSFQSGFPSVGSMGPLYLPSGGGIDIAWISGTVSVSGEKYQNVRINY